MAKKSKSTKKSQATRLPTESIQTLKLLNELQYSLLNGWFERALATSEILINYLPSSSTHLPQALLNRATAFTALERFEEAYNTLNKAVKLSPNDGFILYTYGQACINTSRTAEALIASEKAIKADPSILQEDIIKQDIAIVRKKVKDVLSQFQENITMEQLIDVQEVSLQAQKLMLEEKWEEAEVLLRQLIKKEDIFYQLHNNIATCLMMQGKPVEAEQELLISLKMKPRENKFATNNLETVRWAIKTGKMPELGEI